MNYINKLLVALLVLLAALALRRVMPTLAMGTSPVPLPLPGTLC